MAPNSQTKNRKYATDFWHLTKSGRGAYQDDELAQTKILNTSVTVSNSTTTIRHSLKTCLSTSCFIKSVSN